MNEIYFKIILSLPLFLFLISLFLIKKENGAVIIKKTMFVFMSICFCSSIFFMNQIADSGPLLIDGWDWLSAESFKLNIHFYVDRVATSFFFMTTAMVSLISLYLTSIDKTHENSKGYLALYTLLIFFTQITVFSGNMIMFIMAWSGVGISTCILSHYNNKMKKTLGKLLISNSLGEICLLLGAIGLYLNLGTISFFDMISLSLSNNASSEFHPTTFFFIILGLFIKMALIPFHSWFLNVKNVQPSLLIIVGSGTTLSMGILLLIRLYPFLGNWEHTGPLLCLLGSIAAILGAGITMVKRSIREILLFSTIYHFGFIIISCGVGAYLNAVFYTIGHCFWKGSLLIGEVLILRKTGGRSDIFQIGDMKKNSPLIFWCFLLSSISFLGVPGISALFFQHEILQGAYFKDVGNGIYFLILIAIALGPLCIIRFIGSVFLSSSKIKVNTGLNLPLPIQASFISMAVIAFIVNFIGFPKTYLWNNFDKFDIILANPAGISVPGYPVRPVSSLIFMSIFISLSMNFLGFFIYVLKAKEDLASKIKYSFFTLWSFIEKEFMIKSLFNTILKFGRSTISPLLFLMENIIVIPLKVIGVIIHQIGIFFNLKDFKNIEGGILYIILGITIMMTFVFNSFNL